MCVCGSSAWTGDPPRTFINTISSSIAKVGKEAEKYWPHAKLLAKGRCVLCVHRLGLERDAVRGKAKELLECGALCAVAETPTKMYVIVI